MTDHPLETFKLPRRERVNTVIASFGQIVAGVGCFYLSNALYERAPDMHPVLLFSIFVTGIFFCLFGTLGLSFVAQLWKGAKVDHRGWLHFGGLGRHGSGSIRLSDLTAVAGPVLGARFFSFRTADRAFRVPNYQGKSGSFQEWLVNYAERHSLPTTRHIEADWNSPHPASEDVHRKTRTSLRILKLLGLLAIASILAIAAAAQATLVWFLLLMPFAPMLITILAMPRDRHQSWARDDEIYSIIFGDNGITVSTETRARYYDAEHLFAVRNLLRQEQAPNVEHRFKLTFLDGSNFELTDNKTPENIRRVLACARRQGGPDLNFLIERDLEKLAP